VFCFSSERLQNFSVRHSHLLHSMLPPAGICDQDRSKGRASRAAAQHAKTSLGAIGNMLLVHIGFQYRQELFRKLSAICPRALKVLRQPCPMPRDFEKRRFKGRQIISLPGRSTCLRPAMPAILIYGNSTLNIVKDKWVVSST
jgi:hypothetical protein